MSLRDWRARRVIALAALWVLALGLTVAVRGTLTARRLEREHPGRDVYAVVHLPGGAATLFAPPALLVAAWWWMRRSRPAS